MFSNANTQKRSGSWAPLFLLDFDPNSQALNLQTAECVGMDGQHVISSAFAPKSIKITIGFDGREKEYSGNSIKNMYELRRYILTHFPIGVTGLLKYTNDNGTWLINAALREYPAIENSGGTFCAATIYLVADYPFWRKEITGGLYTADVNDPATVAIYVNGDIASPIVINITMLTAQSGVSDNKYMQIRQLEGGTGKIVICKPLNVGQTLRINTGVNNEIGCFVDGELANHYVDYRNSEQIINNVGETHLELRLYGDSGSAQVQYTYNNLFLAI